MIFVEGWVRTYMSRYVYTKLAKDGYVYTKLAKRGPRTAKDSLHGHMHSPPALRHLHALDIFSLTRTKIIPASTPADSNLDHRGFIPMIINAIVQTLLAKELIVGLLTTYVLS